MSGSHLLKHLTFGAAAFYRIGVQGRLDESWSDRLAGMRITAKDDEAETVVSTLTGRVRDQGELIGVLSSLYELRLPILSVEILDRE